MGEEKIEVSKLADFRESALMTTNIDNGPYAEAVKLLGEWNPLKRALISFMNLVATYMQHGGSKKTMCASIKTNEVRTYLAKNMSSVCDTTVMDVVSALNILFHSNVRYTNLTARARGRSIKIEYMVDGIEKEKKRPRRS